jgi:hypothetical protein
LNESIYRYGSEKFFKLFIESKKLYESGDLVLNDTSDLDLIQSNIGEVGVYENNKVFLNIPYINEAEYKGKKVKLNKPKRNTGSGKKYYVYVKNPKTGKVKKVTFGDKKGGLTAKVSDPKARKAFASRHDCKNKKDKTKAGYWSCRLTKFGHLFGGKTYPGYW